jgi:large repetitive protein
LTTSRLRRGGAFTALLALLLTLFGALPAAAAQGDLTISDEAVTEGTGPGATTMTFEVTAEGPVAIGQATYTIQSGSAQVGVDFTDTSLTPGQLTFGVGQSTDTITITVNRDAFPEDAETFTIVVTPGTGLGCADCTGTGTIANDDLGTVPQVSVADASGAEGSTGAGGEVQFTVTLSAAPVAGNPVTVLFTTTPGTATEGTDYDDATGSLTFTNGDPLTKTITVDTTGDTRDEANETFTLTLSPQNAGCADCVATGTITDDDATPTVSIDDRTAAEGNSGTSNFTFTVTLSAASNLPVTVNYATANGTATAPSDYTAQPSGSVSIPAGSTTATIDVVVVGDTANETDETFTVTLTGATNATVSPDNVGTGTITNDDGLPALTINDQTTAEGASATTNATFTVTLTPGSGRTVTVNYATSPGTASAGSDYTTTSGTLTFEPGDTSKTITVPILHDTLDEPDETYTVTLSNPSNATVADPTGAGTITDNDNPPTIDILDAAAVTEGNVAGGPTASFPVGLSAASGRTITVQYQTSDGSATAGSDYTAKTATLTFNPGETEKTATVAVIGDTVDEPNETFLVTLSSPTGEATLADDDATGTINDDDAGPVVGVTDAFVTELDGPGAELVFTINKVGSTSQSITVAYTTSNGTAVAGEDYTATNGSVTFLPNETAKEVRVPVTGENVPEADETMFLNLTTPAPGGNFTVGDGKGTGTIGNDDGTPPAFSIDDVSQSEGNSGTTTFTFTVTRTNPTGSGATSVDYRLVAGTATVPTDVAAASGTVTMTAAETSKSITINVVGDTTHEANEMFTVLLENPRNATIADGSGTGTIQNDDAVPTITIDSPTVTEGSGGTSVNLVYTLNLSNPRDVAVSVDFATTGGTATAGTDYTSTSLTVTFPAGSTQQQVNVAVAGDDLDENDETVTATLTNAVNAGIGAGESPTTGTITDNDATPTLSINDVTTNEGTGGSTSATFTVTLSAVSGRPVTADYATASGTATSGADFSATSGTISIAAGATSATIIVPVTTDAVDEASESFFVNLTNPGAATIADDQGIGTITDDDGGAVLSVDDVTVTEGDGTATLTFTVTKTGATEQTVTVHVETANGTATQPADYTAVSTDLTFTPAQTTKTVSVPVAADALDEAAETLTLNLSAAVNATIGDASGTGTITDDDPTPTLSVNDVTVTEGGSGTTAATFTVGLSAPSGRAVTVTYGTVNGTATGDDYTTATGTLTFAAGETSKAVAVAVKGDTVDEDNESFTLVLSNPSNATVTDGSGTGTVTDDDSPAPTPPASGAGQGYSLVGEDGSLYTYGTAKNLGDMRGTKLNAPVIGVAYTPGGNGYWLVARDGGIFTFGNAVFHGSMGDKKLNSPIIGMAATPSGNGYWLFAGDGGIFTFGDAEFFGSMGDKKLNAPVINMEPVESGTGYWLVAADGGIFTFGTAEFFGSMGDQKINQPVFDMTSTDTDDGYWLVARDGGIFSFGDAAPKFFGSAVNETPRPTRVIGMDSTPGSLGYWIADANGKVYPYGNAQHLGDRYLAANPAPMIGFSSVPGVKPGT